MRKKVIETEGPFSRIFKMKTDLMESRGLLSSFHLPRVQLDDCNQFISGETLNLSHDQ